ncbi:MAG TPA: pentapeptide repeat-containing protein [Flavobacteriales bacterium]|nr:pentapeptide repeat-containing protein [Flavobacteriales bacterium]
MPLITEKTYDKLNFKEIALEKGEYEICTFKNCDFSNADLSLFKFTESTFINCNLSLAKLTNTSFRDVTFTDCKLMGLHFDSCNAFNLSFRFEGCMLNHSSFYKLKLKNIVLKKCQLHEVDFTESDLTAATFDNCDLTNAKFEHSILEKADFRSAFNFSIDPESNKMKKAKFSSQNIQALLYKYDLHIE